MLPIPPQAPPQMPSHWLVYFAVDDIDAAAERVGALGGQVMMPRVQSPAGVLSIVADPQGAPFAIIQLGAA
jgi:predicted enzyme related to lactoylglutathione lyase